jgi:hypothetical protein
MLRQLRSIRAATLNNNITWLEGFGCQVSREGNLISIEHPELPGYSVRLLFGSSEKVLKQLQAILNRAERGKDRADIFIDKSSTSPTISSALASAGFTATSVNVTKYNDWEPAQREATVTLQLASPDDFEQWTALYSDGFSHGGEEAERDRYRWRIAFNAQQIRHWFIMKEKDRLGVCQTCLSNGVTGIYSFTLDSTKRGLRYLRPAIRALRSKLIENGETSVYFERLWHKNWFDKQRIANDQYGFKVVRIMIGFRRVSEKN